MQAGHLTKIERSSSGRRPRFLLIGPYDPHGGEYTFLSPPLGVWRLQGFLSVHGMDAHVFDPNSCEGSASMALTNLLSQESWDVVGCSTTSMTLVHDLPLAHLARRLAPTSTFVAGGMEATFRPDLMFKLGPFDLVVLGEGEFPLLELGERLRDKGSISGIAGTAFLKDGKIQQLPRPALNNPQFRDSVYLTPYRQMPYDKYWRKLADSYRVGNLPAKAERDARLAEICSVRLMTLNYCPMRCTFCSSTNFLNAAQGSTAPIVRLNTEECLEMICRIVQAQPGVKTIIFQDDIFVFRNDKRILPLCRGIIEAKSLGQLPQNLQFISTNRVDAMTRQILVSMRSAGFRVLGFGVESFSLSMLKEFNKAQIQPHVVSTLDTALKLGITPFLDMILTSPRCSLNDLAENISQAFRWIQSGCEVGMYPYVIPFSGAAMAADPSLKSQTIYASHSIEGTNITWRQASKILPSDTATREAILEIEAEFAVNLSQLTRVLPHLPSRLRSLVWLKCAIPVLAKKNCEVPPYDLVQDYLVSQLPSGPARQPTPTWSRPGTNSVGAEAWTGV